MAVKGRAMPRKKGTTRPIMRLLELLSRRWALRVLWELRDGPHGFRTLQQRCGDVSPTSLSQRLKELSDARILTVDDKGYQYSRSGKELVARLMPVYEWASRWSETE
jgi:DNA-binding HxlR family transcriptional regulator